jgi:membrane protease YdiL (CAAX protease family)
MNWNTRLQMLSPARWLTSRLTSFEVPLAVRVTALLILYKNMTRLLPDSLYDPLSFLLNLAAATLLIVWSIKQGLSWEALGLVPKHLTSALRLGLGCGFILSMPSFLALLFPAQLASFVDTGQWQQMSYLGLMYRAMVGIPVGIAIFEEVAFRGVLYGLWTSYGGYRPAIVSNSIAFGLWHIAPMYDLVQGGTLFSTPFHLAAGITSGIVLTALGGCIFTWIRYQTGSIYGVAVSHWLIDTTAMVTGFISTR